MTTHKKEDEEEVDPLLLRSRSEEGLLQLSSSYGSTASNRLLVHAPRMVGNKNGTYMNPSTTRNKPSINQSYRLRPIDQG